MSSFGVPCVRSTAQTSGVATAVIGSLSIADGESYFLMGRAIGRAAAGASVGATRFAVVKRVAGVTSRVGVDATIPLVADAALAGAVVTIDVNGNNAELQVTGVALQTIDWMGLLEALEFAP